MDQDASVWRVLARQQAFSQAGRKCHTAQSKARPCPASAVLGVVIGGHPPRRQERVSAPAATPVYRDLNCEPFQPTPAGPAARQGAGQVNADIRCTRTYARRPAPQAHARRGRARPAVETPQHPASGTRIASNAELGRSDAEPAVQPERFQRALASTMGCQPRRAKWAPENVGWLGRRPPCLGFEQAWQFQARDGNSGPRTPPGPSG